VTLGVGGPAPSAPAPSEVAPPEPGPGPTGRDWRITAAHYFLAGAGYLVVSVVLWWHVWTSHPTTTATCGCGDPALFTWFLEWPAFALSHAKSLFFSGALFHPHGINLLANTSVLAIGIPLAPITWAFGPIATLNVASTVVPVATGLCAFWMLRRFVTWMPAAFVGGLLYAFSPFVLQSLAFGHLMTADLALLPLVVGALDELLIRQRRSAWLVGVLLGLALCVQFFVSTEVLAITLLSGALGIVVLAGYGIVVDRTATAAHARVAVPGLVATAVTTLVLLAYPAWYALAGPAHLSGQIWPHIPVIGGYTPNSFIDPGSGATRSLLLEIGGYLGTPLASSSYIGWGMLVVVVVGLIAWRRDRRLWFFATMALISAALSLGERKHHWVPWQLFDRTPVLDNVVEQRFMAICYLALAVLLAVILERAWRSVPPRGASGVSPSWRGAWRIAMVALAVGVSLGPMANAFASSLPYAVRSVDLPQWYAVRGANLAPGQVLLAYPAPFSGIQSSMAWQAVNGMRYAQAGGGGPQGTPGRAGAQRPGFMVLANLGFGFAAAPTATPVELRAVRAALSAWKVTMVVIPNRAGPSILVGHDATYAAAFMTAALGEVPRYEDSAWVWSMTRSAPPPLRVVPGTLARCTSASEMHFGPRSVGVCVLGRSHRGRR